MSVLTLRQLEIFTQAVEHGSFRRCAEHIGISQVAISDHIRELERRLDQKLFERRPGESARLTPTGEEVYRRSKDILADVESLVLDFGQTAERRQRRTITVGTQAFIVQYLQDAIAEFEQSRGNVSVSLDLNAFSEEAVVDGMHAHALDMAYFLCVDPPRELDSELVYHEEMAIFIGDNHPLWQRPHITVEDLTATPVLHLSAGNPLRRLTEQCLYKGGLSGSPLALETDDFGLLMTYVRRNHGYLCTFKSLEKLVSETSGLRPVPLEHPLPPMQVRLALRHSLRHDRLVLDLATHLSNALVTSISAGSNAIA